MEKERKRDKESDFFMIFKDKHCQKLGSRGGDSE